MKHHRPHVKRHRPIVNGHRPNVKRHGPIVNRHRPNVKRHRPIVNRHGPIVNRHRPNVSPHGIIFKFSCLCGFMSEPSTSRRFRNRRAETVFCGCFKCRHRSRGKGRWITLRVLAEGNDAHRRWMNAHGGVHRFLPRSSTTCTDPDKPTAERGDTSPLHQYGSSKRGRERQEGASPFRMEACTSDPADQFMHDVPPGLPYTTPNPL